MTHQIEVPEYNFKSEHLMYSSFGKFSDKKLFAVVVWDRHNNTTDSFFRITNHGKKTDIFDFLRAVEEYNNIP